MLDTLRDVKKVNGRSIIHMDELRETFPERFDKESGQMDYKWFELTEIRIPEIVDSKYIIGYMRKGK